MSWHKSLNDLSSVSGFTEEYMYVNMCVAANAPFHIPVLFMTFVLKKNDFFLHVSVLMI